MDIVVVPYDPAWPKHFRAVEADLASDLALYHAEYISIEHVGSTSIPDLAAKPILDIAIVIADATKFERVHYALIWGERQGGYRHIGNGGVEGRWSFKLYNILPQRNLYVVLKDSMVLRSYLDLRETLRADPALRDEYGELKIKLAQQEWNDVMEYATAKNGMIRKILLKAGWTQDEIDEKERRAVKSWFGASRHGEVY
jgi:GrpB-like predicted nucleotidyltransferase (UPF0157 family)